MIQMNVKFVTAGTLSKSILLISHLYVGVVMQTSTGFNDDVVDNIEKKL